MPIELKELSECPEAAPTVARWYFDEWGPLIDGETYEKSLAGLQAYMRDGQMPVLVVATDHGVALGAAQLKFHEMAEAYPDLEHWLGGVYVAKAHRGKGIATKLVKRIIEIAPQHGVTRLYLQTLALDGGLYARLGWKPLEQHHGPQHVVLVMEKDL